MHTCISSHGLKRSWRSCPRRVNAGNKNTPSTHHPRRRNVTTLMVGLKKTVTYAKILPKSGEPQRYSWGTHKKKTPKNQWHYKNGILVVTLLNVRYHGVIAKNGWPGVSPMVDETASLICNFCLSVGASVLVYVDPICETLVAKTQQRIEETNKSLIRRYFREPILTPREKIPSTGRLWGGSNPRC